MYSYSREYTYSTKYIVGVYDNIEEAILRANSYGLDPTSDGLGVYYSKDGWVTFINEIPYGASKTELFTNKV